MNKTFILAVLIAVSLIPSSQSFSASKPLEIGLTMQEIIAGLESILWITGGMPPYTVISRNPYIAEVSFDNKEKYYVVRGKNEGLAEIIVRDSKNVMARASILVIKPTQQKTPQPATQTQQDPFKPSDPFIRPPVSTQPKAGMK